LGVTQTQILVQSTSSKLGNYRNLEKPLRGACGKASGPARLAVGAPWSRPKTPQAAALAPALGAGALRHRAGTRAPWRGLPSFSWPALAADADDRSNDRGFGPGFSRLTGSRRLRRKKWLSPSRARPAINKTGRGTVGTVSRAEPNKGRKKVGSHFFMASRGPEKPVPPKLFIKPAALRLIGGPFGRQSGRSFGPNTVGMLSPSQTVWFRWPEDAGLGAVPSDWRF